MIPIDDRTFDSLEWTEVDGVELHNIITGQTITGTEPIDPDGILIYLMDSGGNSAVLYVSYDCLTRRFGVYYAELITKERSTGTETQKSKG